MARQYWSDPESIPAPGSPIPVKPSRPGSTVPDFEDVLAQADAIFAVYCQMSLRDLRDVMQRTGAEFAAIKVRSDRTFQPLNRRAIRDLRNDKALVAIQREMLVEVICNQSSIGQEHERGIDRLAELLDAIGEYETVSRRLSKQMRHIYPSDNNRARVLSRLAGAAEFGAAKSLEAMRSIEAKMRRENPSVPTSELVDVVRLSPIAMQISTVATAGERLFTQTLSASPDGVSGPHPIHHENLVPTSAGGMRLASSPCSMPGYFATYADENTQRHRPANKTVGEVLAYDPLGVNKGMCPAGTMVVEGENPFIPALWEMQTGIMSVRWEHEAMMRADRESDIAETYQGPEF